MIWIILSYKIQKIINEKNLKHKTKLHQLKVELLKIQKINNLKQRCKKNNKKSTKKLRERNNLFCEGKLCIEIQNRKDNENFIIGG